MGARILVADDDRLMRTIFADALRAAGHHVGVVANGVEALARLGLESWDILLTDLLMPEMDGLELLERAKQLFPSLDVIMLTSVGTAEPAVRALRSGAFHYLVKPVDPEALQLEVHRCLESRRLLAENEELRRYQQILGAAQRITTCLDRERLHPLAVDALAALVDADAGLLFRLRATDSGSSGALEVLGLRGLDGEEALSLAERVWARHGERVAVSMEAVSIDELGRNAPPGAPERASASPGDETLGPIEHGLFVPIHREGVLLGVVLLLRRAERRSFWAGHAREVAFLAESVGLALENADRYVQAQWVAHLDALTGLYNARHLEHVIDREVRTRNTSGAPFSVLFMDLDHFKRVNDTHGHQVGSRVIVEMARLLRRQTRETDVLIRYGGDEFVAILPDADTGTALLAAERIRAAVEGHRFLSREGLELRLTLCCGVSTWPRHALTREDMIHCADMAMYHGKKTHRNAVYEYDTVPTMPAPGVESTTSI